MEFFHVAVIVNDLDAAMDELTRAVGLEWRTPKVREFDPWKIRVVFSKSGSPFIELIEAPPGSPWEATPENRADTITYWSEDLEADRARLAEIGLTVAIDGAQWGANWSYHSTQHSGIRVALVDAAKRGEFMLQV